MARLAAFRAVLRVRPIGHRAEQRPGRGAVPFHQSVKGSVQHCGRVFDDVGEPPTLEVFLEGVEAPRLGFGGGRHSAASARKTGSSGRVPGGH